MFKGLFLPLFLLFTCSSFAQKKEGFVGKWKIIFASNGVSYDYKKGEEIVTKEFQRFLTGRRDSVEMIAKYAQFAKQYDDYYFVFEANGNFKEIDGDNTRLDGVYRINKAGKKIELKVKVGNSDKVKNLEMKYNFVNNELHVFVKSFFLERGTELVAEKVAQ